jgi:NAD(P)H-dependent flavin oxidoreductase YrpB (nitropropane dioxygenase family)
MTSGIHYPLPCTNLLVPVVQASLGPCDCPRLAAAVSEAGGLGTLSFTKPSVDEVERALLELRRLTQKPVLLSFLGDWEHPDVLAKCFQHKMRHFQIQWWNGARLAPLLRKAGALIYWQVGSLQQAEEAYSHTPDAFILPGTESGGPVRTSYPIQTLLALIRDHYPQMPLIAGGGLSNANDVAQICALGAAAALMGTRFLLSEEALTSPEARVSLQQATLNDLFLDSRLVGEWPCAPRRRLKDAPDCATYFAGKGIGDMPEVLPAAQILARLNPATV